MSQYDHHKRFQRAVEEPLKLVAFGRTGPRTCFARYDGNWCVRIQKHPTCTCPDNRRFGRNGPCKHIMKTTFRILGCTEEQAVQSEWTEEELAALFEPSPTHHQLKPKQGRQKRKAPDQPKPKQGRQKRKAPDMQQRTITKKQRNSYQTKYILEGPLAEVNKVADELLRGLCHVYSPYRSKPKELGQGRVQMEVSHCNSCE